MYNPTFNQQMAQLDQEYAKKKAEIMQSFYPQPTPPQAQAPTPTQNVNWIYVTGVEGARNHIVQPGNTAWLMDNNEPYFYVKKVDGVGSCDFKIFRIEEVQEAVKEQPKQDMSQYVLRDEFDALKAQLNHFVDTNKKVSAKGKENDNG